MNMFHKLQTVLVQHDSTMSSLPNLQTGKLLVMTVNRCDFSAGCLGSGAWGGPSPATAAAKSRTLTTFSMSPNSCFSHLRRIIYTRGARSAALLRPAGQRHKKWHKTACYHCTLYSTRVTIFMGWLVGTHSQFWTHTLSVPFSMMVLMMLLITVDVIRASSGAFWLPFWQF